VSTSGRSGTGAYTYRRNRGILLAGSDLCALCGHYGARTADHKITAKDWPKNPLTGRPLPGFDDLTNLQPAHGTMGGRQPDNPCPVCGLLCNQRRGARSGARPATRDWFPDRA
jgi:hypothetical protein